jgi:CRISPR-associated protein Csd2
MSKIIQHRYEFVLLADVVDGNYGGDPDADNNPRVDSVTNQGIITDACSKRKIRNYVALTRKGESPNRIFIREKSVLNDTIQNAFLQQGIDLRQETGTEGQKRLPTDTKKKDLFHALESEKQSAREYLCKNYFDIRTFGGVLGTGWNCGEIKGTVRITFGRSIDPVTIQEHTITRVAVTSERESIEQGGMNQTMGRKATVPYGLFRIHGFVSAFDAEKTGFSEDDLALLWEALGNMYEHDRSAARGMMSTRGLYVFRHDRPLGYAPAYKLFDRIKVEKKATVEYPRKFSDYDIQIIGEEVAHVELIRMIG